MTQKRPNDPKTTLSAKRPENDQTTPKRPFQQNDPKTTLSAKRPKNDPFSKTTQKRPFQQNDPKTTLSTKRPQNDPFCKTTQKRPFQQNDPKTTKRPKNDPFCKTKKRSFCFINLEYKMKNKNMNKLKKYLAGINMMALSSMLRYWIAVVYYFDLDRVAVDRPVFSFCYPYRLLFTSIIEITIPLTNFNNCINELAIGFKLIYIQQNWLMKLQCNAATICL
ncbi:hypothetical protein BDC45DRAFT_557842 [Circinella umbellata]|nr:hypothetical protein BDC45DRAFT_557842 [Circinella umbellata]